MSRVHIYDGEVLYRTQAGEHLRLYSDEGVVSIVPLDSDEINLTARDARMISRALSMFADEVER